MRRFDPHGEAGRRRTGSQLSAPAGTADHGHRGADNGGGGVAGLPGRRANALIHPLSNGLIVDQVAVRNRAFSFGLKQAAIPTATLTAGLSAPVFALTVRWNWTFALAALLAASLVQVLFRTLPLVGIAGEAAVRS